VGDVPSDNYNDDDDKNDNDDDDDIVKPGEEISEQDSWITPETRTHRDIWTSKHIPKETKKRSGLFSTISYDIHS